MRFHKIPLCIRAAVVFAAASLVAAPAVYPAATLTVINNDAPGQGFNDPTPAAPVGGNTGTTVGAQRLIAFQYAADIWAPLITSSVPVRVRANFVPLDCDNSSGVLGAAGPTTVHRDFPGAPRAATWYVQALANSLFGGDLYAGDDDIEAVFNSDIGTPGCLQASGWYYGLDGNTPAGKLDFVTVLAHELGHGLGFLSLVSLSTGAKFSNLDDAYMVHLEDHGTGKSFPQMTNIERYNASRNPGNLHWTGANVVVGGAGLTDGRHASGHVEMFAPSPVEPGSSVSHFNTDLNPNELMEPYYVSANHDVGLALALMADLGWGVSIPTVDVVAPGKVVDLKKAASMLTEVNLSWTAPGDDGYAGTASAYDLRVSSSPINDSNWASASQLGGAPVPGVAGVTESFAVPGLLCGRNYYFALKTMDDAGNVSALSNVARARTLKCPKLAVSPSVLPDAEVGVPYNASYGISGGVGPYTVQVTSGLPEPAGLALVDQTVSGNPAAAQTWRFRVEITDQIGSSARKNFRVRIRQPAAISTSDLAVGTVGRSYSTALKATGGMKSYSWSLVAGTLPAGMSFDGSTGRITGVPTSAGVANLTFQVTDALGGTAQTMLPLIIN